MEFGRVEYIKRLEESRNNGFIKVISGLRSVGKTYLLLCLFYNHLIRDGFEPWRIITVELAKSDNADLRDSRALYAHIKAQIRDDGPFIVMIDDIQAVEGFEEVLNSLLHCDNVDIYVTTRRAKGLCDDTIFEFRGRSQEVRLYPLTYSEFLEGYEGDPNSTWEEFCKYGGMPSVVLAENAKEKERCLEEIERKILRDLTGRYKIKDISDIPRLVRIISESEGRSVNASKLSEAFTEKFRFKLSRHTIERYISYLEDSFLLEPVSRHDIKLGRILGAERRYYLADCGIRDIPGNKLNGIICRELLFRGFSVQVGVAIQNCWTEKGNGTKKRFETGFVATKSGDLRYVQTYPTLADNLREIAFLFSLIRDVYPRVVVTEDKIIPHRDADGILFINAEDFLKDKNSLKR